MSTDRLKQFLGPRSLPQTFYSLDYSIRIFRGLFKRFPLRRDNSGLSCTPFFIIGSGRSGSTLLRAMLTMNPTVCIPPESYVLGRAIRNYKYFSFLPWNLLSRIVISEFESFPQFKSWDINLRGFYQIAQCMPEDDRNLAKLLDNFYSNYASEKMPDSKRWGDKTPVNTFAVNLIHEVFPSSKHIHMIRDGRDVVASYLSAGLYPNVEEAARRWIRSVEAGQSFGRKIGDIQYLEIHYESLVRRPQEVVMKVCNFLEIEYLPEMLEPWKRIGYLGDAYLPHHLNLLNPINEDSIGKWETRLNQQDQAYVQNHLQSKLLVLGYSTG